MFEQIKKKEFLVLYEKFQVGARWLADREARGVDNKAHLADFRQIENQVDKEWEKFSDYEKDEILNCLKSSLPERILEIKEMFNGKIISLT